ncbi:MAG: hypothetical protein FJY56_02915 [Betaproteobacteria bacterium]|nr:hypothetical protein [Betaproteobacteria bacterium]
MPPTKKAVIDDQALAFYRTLKKTRFPKALIDEFPRIANRVYELRDDKHVLGKYFQSLLTDERRGRRGFPFAVLLDIQNLYDDIVGIPGSFDIRDIRFFGVKRSAD